MKPKLQVLPVCFCITYGMSLLIIILGIKYFNCLVILEAIKRFCVPVVALYFRLGL